MEEDYPTTACIVEEKKDRKTTQHPQKYKADIS